MPSPELPTWVDHKQGNLVRAKGIHPTNRTRAVLRTIEPGSHVECACCGEKIKFQAKRRLPQVVCNVYTFPNGVDQNIDAQGEPLPDPEASKEDRAATSDQAARWREVVHFHVEPPCYVEAGQPYGPVFGEARHSS